jgi:hypothetical protein
MQWMLNKSMVFKSPKGGCLADLQTSKKSNNDGLTGD